jgi:TPR repeat protein
LLVRGDEFVRMRDIASARLLYERAARMRETAVRHCEWESFDPAFLDRIGIYQMAGDRQRALSWYRRARDLGDAEAVPGSESESSVGWRRS